MYKRHTTTIVSSDKMFIHDSMHVEKICLNQCTNLYKIHCFLNHTVKIWTALPYFYFHITETQQAQHTSKIFHFLYNQTQLSCIFSKYNQYIFHLSQLLLSIFHKLYSPPSSIRPFVMICLASSKHIRDCLDYYSNQASKKKERNFIKLYFIKFQILCTKSNFIKLKKKRLGLISSESTVR